jgi:MoxR-like ATPase
LLDGREYVVPDDVKTLATDSLSHRVVPVAGLRLERGRARKIVKEIVDGTEVPVTGPPS